MGNQNRLFIWGLTLFLVALFSGEPIGEEFNFQNVFRVVCKILLIVIGIRKIEKSIKSNTGEL